MTATTSPTPITSATKKNAKADEKHLAEMSEKHGADISAIERRKISCIKLLRSSYRAVEAIATKPNTDIENACEMALENIEDARAKLEKIEELVRKVKDAS